MSSHKRFFSLHAYLTWLLWLCCVSVGAWAQGDQKPDVRLVIDVSGSMKRNDPNNLRQPAVELLVRMVPDGAKAGVWTFGQSVNMLIPHRTVNAEWRAVAARKAGDINSVGLFTNIGGALETAAYDLQKRDPSYLTSVILLTDGMVDISKSAAENEAERRRVVEQVFPSLKQAGYKVHAVALSDEADMALMEKLALTTGGTFAVANTADDLMKIFLRAFDQAVPSQKVPLQNNRFLVDSSIDEFTALIFRTDPAEQTRLIGPDQLVMRSDKFPKDVSWLRTRTYDLVTVKDPYEGEWQIVAAFGPESRVTVVSNLALRVKTLPNNLVLGASETLSFVLYADGKAVTDRTFLGLLQVNASLRYGRTEDAVAEPVWSTTVAGDSADDKGVFTIPLPTLEKMGVYDLQLSVDGKTFQRQFSHRISVREPFSVHLEDKYDSNGVLQHLLTVRAHSEQIDPHQTQVAASVINPIRRRLVRPMELVDTGEWRTTVPMDYPGEYKITVQVSGTDTLREPFSYELTPVTYTRGDEDPLFAPEPEISEPEPQPQPQPEPQPVEPEPEVVAEPEPEEESGALRWLWYALLGLGNFAILAGGYGLWRWWRRRKSEGEGNLLIPETAAASGTPPSESRKKQPVSAAPAREEEPPMEDLEDDSEDDYDMMAMDDFERDLVDKVMAGEPQKAKDDFAAEIRRAQGLDMGEKELDEAITTLIDELDGERPEVTPPPDDLDDFPMDDNP